MKIGYGLEIDIIVPIANGVGGVLMKAIANFFPVQLDGAACDVLGALGVDLVLEGHVLEVDAVDLEKKDLSGQVVAEDDLPLEVIVRDFQREQSRL